MLSDASKIHKMNAAMSSNIKPASAKKSEKADNTGGKNLENVKSFAKSQGKAKKSPSMNELDTEDESIKNESELLDLEETDEEVKSEKKQTHVDDDVMDLLNKKYPNNKHVDELKTKLKEFFDNGQHFEDLEEDIQFQVKVMFSEREHEEFDAGFDASRS